MMVRQAILIAFIALYHTLAFSQRASLPSQANPKPEKPWLALRKNNKEGLYLKTFLHLVQTPAYTDATSTPFDRADYYDVLVQLYNYFGEYQKAAKAEEKFLTEVSTISKTPRVLSPPLAGSALDSLQMVGASQAIAGVAEKQQIIMINEEHRATVHREMTLELLPMLYKKGFRYLALETLFQHDTLLNQRKYPTYETGSYTHDPVLGEVIRQALRIGFTVVGYDYLSEKVRVNNANPFARDNARDSVAARNIIASVLTKDPQAKLLVHAGRAHASRLKTDKLAMLGWHLREYSGITPFCIDQVKMSGFTNAKVCLSKANGISKKRW